MSYNLSMFNKLILYITYNGKIDVFITSNCTDKFTLFGTFNKSNYEKD